MFRHSLMEDNSDTSKVSPPHQTILLFQPTEGTVLQAVGDS